MKLIKEIIFGQIRHAATLAGGALVTHGLVNSSGAQQFTGAVMALAGVGWSIGDKWLRAEFPAESGGPSGTGSQSILEKL
jgi:hypothetical protein